MGIDVKGKIVIARYGGSWRGTKAKTAQENGAIGSLIYSDSHDDGYYRGDAFPEGPWRPAESVQRGSVMDLPVYVGDPLSPGWASEKGARKLARAEATSIMKIPVLPISYADAQPLLAVNLDQKQPGFPADILPAYLKSRGVPFHIEEQDTYSVVKRVIPEGKTTCSLCSRLRRGVLYRVAGELGATKIALGYHRDDILETLFLNLFYGGKLKAMPPKLVSDDGRHIVIRPLAYCRERDLEAWAALRRFPIIPCDLCGSQEQLKRKETKALLREWDRRFPGRVEKIFAALGNVAPSHLADPRLYDFRNLKADGRPDPEGDRAFDGETFDDPDIIPLHRGEGV